MALKDRSAWFLKESTDSTNKSINLESSDQIKQQRRAQALRDFPILGICMLCGDAATHRHSKEGHFHAVSLEDTVMVCANCHYTIHHGDRAERGASWAWKNPA